MKCLCTYIYFSIVCDYDMYVEYNKIIENHENFLLFTYYEFIEWEIFLFSYNYDYRFYRNRCVIMRLF